jgi:serine/threonine kinase 16
MSLLTHPNILRCECADIYTSSPNKREGLLVLPFYRRGSVQDLLSRALEHAPGGSTSAAIIYAGSKPAVAWDGDVKAMMHAFLGAASGIAALHALSPPRAFRDLKPANVLLDDEGAGVLADLGSVAPGRVKIESRKEVFFLPNPTGSVIFRSAPEFRLCLVSS